MTTAASITVYEGRLDERGLEAAARAVHELTGGGLPFGRSKGRHRPTVAVSCSLAAEAAVRAYLEARAS